MDDKLVEKTIEEFLEQLGKMSPEERAKVLDDIANECYDGNKDIILEQHLDDIGCDEVCESCEPSERLECILELKRTVYYLAHQYINLKARVEQVNSKADAIAYGTFGPKEGEKPKDEFDIMRDRGQII